MIFFIIIHDTVYFVILILYNSKNDKTFDLKNLFSIIKNYYKINQINVLPLLIQ